MNQERQRLIQAIILQIKNKKYKSVYSKGSFTQELIQFIKAKNGHQIKVAQLIFLILSTGNPKLIRCILSRQLFLQIFNQLQMLSKSIIQLQISNLSDITIWMKVIKQLKQVHQAKQIFQMIPKQFTKVSITILNIILPISKKYIQLFDIEIYYQNWNLPLQKTNDKNQNTLQQNINQSQDSQDSQEDQESQINHVPLVIKDNIFQIPQLQSQKHIITNLIQILIFGLKQIAFVSQFFSPLVKDIYTLYRNCTFFTICEITQLYVYITQKVQLSHHDFQKVVIVPMMNMVYYKYLPQIQKLWDFTKLSFIQKQYYKVRQNILQCLLNTIKISDASKWALQYSPLLSRFAYSCYFAQESLFYFALNIINIVYQNCKQKIIQDQLLKYLVLHGIMSCKFQVCFFQYLIIKANFTTQQLKKLFRGIGLRINNIKRYDNILPISHIINNQEVAAQMILKLGHMHQRKLSIVVQKTRPKKFQFITLFFMKNYKSIIKKIKQRKWAEPNRLQPLFKIDIDLKSPLSSSKSTCFFCLQFEDQLENMGFYQNLKQNKKYRNLTLISFIKIIDNYRLFQEWQLEILIQYIFKFIAVDEHYTNFKFYGLLLLQIYLQDAASLNYLLDIHLIQFLTSKLGQYLIRFYTYPFILIANEKHKIFIQQSAYIKQSSKSQIQTQQTKIYQSLKAISKQYRRVVLLEPIWHNLSRKILFVEQNVSANQLIKRFSSKSKTKLLIFQAHNFVHTLMIILQVIKKRPQLIRQFENKLQSLINSVYGILLKYKQSQSEDQILMVFLRQQIILFLKIIRRIVSSIQINQQSVKLFYKTKFVRYQYYVMQIIHYTPNRLDYFQNIIQLKYHQVYELRQLAILMAWQPKLYQNSVQILYPFLRQFINIQLMKQTINPIINKQIDFIDRIKKLSNQQLRGFIFNRLVQYLGFKIKEKQNERVTKLLFSGLQKHQYLDNNNLYCLLNVFASFCSNYQLGYKQIYIFIDLLQKYIHKDHLSDIFYYSIKNIASAGRQFLNTVKAAYNKRIQKIRNANKAQAQNIELMLGQMSKSDYQFIKQIRKSFSYQKSEEQFNEQQMKRSQRILRKQQQQSFYKQSQQSESMF